MEGTPQEDDVSDLLPHHRLPRAIRKTPDRQRWKNRLDLEPNLDQKDTEIRSHTQMNKEEKYFVIQYNEKLKNTKIL